MIPWTRIGRFWPVLLLLALGILGVTSTYTRLSQTDDEGFHVSCGMEWWEKGTYTIQPLHPPLARVMDAAFLHLANVIYHGKTFENVPMRDAYIDRLILTRLGMLPFYILSCWLVWAVSRRLYGVPASLAALAIYISLSTVTAHAGLATTDMPYTAVFLWAVIAACQWLAAPTKRNSLLLGLSLGVMMGTKFSGIAHWPAAMAMILAGRAFYHYRQRQPLFAWRKDDALHLLLYAVPIGILALALIYRFSFTAFFQGIKDAHRLSAHGFGVWLYEPLHHRGVWYFFPVVFFFKTPLPFMVASLIGNGRIFTETLKGAAVQRLYPLLAAIGVMLVSMTSNINLGVRHVLPLYPLLAAGAGYGLYWLWQAGAWKRALAVVLLLWQLVSFIAAYPEHIAYFNILAGPHPEHITLDSDYDWGQDMILLDEALTARGITQAYMCARKDTYWNARFVVHAKILECPKEPASGWFAVGRAYMQLPNKIAWLKSYEAVQIGSSTMDLYFIPPKDDENKP